MHDKILQFFNESFNRIRTGLRIQLAPPLEKKLKKFLTNGNFEGIHFTNLEEHKKLKIKKKN